MKALEHAAIFADDQEALVDWYCTTLGFELISKGDLGNQLTYYFLACLEELCSRSFLPTRNPVPRRPPTTRALGI